MNDTLDIRVLAALEPISSFSPARLRELLDYCHIENVEPGRDPFKDRSMEGQSVYLVRGELALTYADGNQVTMRADSEWARHPIGKRQPDIVAANALSRVQLLRVDDDLLDRMVTWDQFASHDDIKPKIEVVERAAWIQRRNSGEWDLFDFNWWADLDPDETITPEFRTGEAWNYPGWSNKRFDELVNAAQDTLDVAKRKEYYTEACDILMNEAPIAIVSHMPVFKAFSQKVKDFKYIPVDSLNLHTVSLG